MPQCSTAGGALGAACDATCAVLATRRGCVTICCHVHMSADYLSHAERVLAILA